MEAQLLELLTLWTDQLSLWEDDIASGNQQTKHPCQSLNNVDGIHFGESGYEQNSTLTLIGRVV